MIIKTSSKMLIAMNIMTLLVKNSLNYVGRIELYYHCRNFQVLRNLDDTFHILELHSRIINLLAEGNFEENYIFLCVPIFKTPNIILQPYL